MSVALLAPPTSPAVIDATFAQMAAGLAPHSFPSLDDVHSVVDRLRLRHGQHVGDVGHGAHLAYLQVSPGTVGIRLRDVGRMQLTDGLGVDPLERLAGAASEGVDAPAQGVLFDLEEMRTARGVITEWSAYSRQRMARTIAELDYSGWADDGGDLAMVTFTLSEAWQLVAPTGTAFKALFDTFRKRWLREVRTPWRGLWKLEFQRRGAPHLHTLMRIPVMVHPSSCGWCSERERWAARDRILRADLAASRERLGRLELLGARRGVAVSQAARERAVARLLGHIAACPVGGACDSVVFSEWLSQTWADVCLHSMDPDVARAYEEAGEYRRHLAAGTGIDFSGVKFSDPRRTSIYFSKHSSKAADDKEYQHVVPEDWRAEGAGPGRFWGVWGIKSARVELLVDEWTMKRARRFLRGVARGRKATTDINRLRAAGDRGQVFRMRRYAARSLTTAGGWVLVNDGLSLAWDLGRALALTD